MATIATVSGIHTPNEGRVIWNNNISAVNTEVEGLSTTIGAVGGSIVGTTQTQVLTNKTLVSSYRGGTNTLTVSRRDLEATSLFLITADSGSVSNIDVSAASQYSLQILGSDSIETSVTSNILYIQNKEVCIMNETSQVLGIKVAAVTSGNVAEFGGNVLIDNYLAVGAGHSAAATTTMHIKDTNPTLKVESTGTSSYLSFTNSSKNYSFTSNFTSEYTEFRMDGTRIFNLEATDITLDQDVTFAKVAGSHTIVGDLDVQGTLTAGGLVATATDVVINNGPVTISGGWSFIADGAIEHDKLASLTSTYVFVGNSSNVVTAVEMTGDVTISNTGVTTIGSDKVTLAMLKGSSLLDDKILSTNGTTIQAAGTAAGSDITFSRDGTDLSFTIKSNIIDNANINSTAAIEMSKTAFAVSVSGLIMNGNTLELSGPKSDVLFRDVPTGTIIAYGGDLTGLAPTGIVEPIDGWLFCNGESIPNSGKHADLYSVLGTAWGGAGVLPNLVGSFLRGVDPGAAVDPDAGSRTGGNAAEIGSWQDDAIKEHTHYVRDIANNLDPGGGYTPTTGTSSAGVQNATTMTPAGADETRPVNYAVAYLIKL